MKSINSPRGLVQACALLVRKSPFKQFSIDCLLADHGEEMRGVSGQFINGFLGMCFANCVRAVRADKGLRYCEGYAMPKGLVPVYHAWLLDENGKVIEPTWQDAYPNCQPQYYGVAIKREVVLKIQNRQCQSILINPSNRRLQIMKLEPEKWKEKTGPL